MFKKHYKKGISALKKQKHGKKTMFKVNNWAKLKSIIGPSWGSKKNQLGPVIEKGGTLNRKLQLDTLRFGMES